MDTGARAELFDGLSAVRHPVGLRWQSAGLEVAPAEAAPETIPDTMLMLIENRGDRLVFGHRDRKGWRLLVPVDAPPALLARMPKGGTYGGWIDRFGLLRASVVLGIACVIAVTGVMTAPTWLGPLVPESWERRIGSALVGDLESFACATPESDAAVAVLVRKVDDAKVPVTVQLVNIDMVNAVALPGGRILIFDQLLQEAKSPDEIAGVLAHEVGHVRKRHVMQALLRQFGLSMLLSGANSDLGGTIGGIAAMGYSRDAEREADAFSRRRLDAADISPSATAAFFGRLRKIDPTSARVQLSYLSSHPDPGEREQAFSAAVRSGEVYRPALTAAQFLALRQACAKDPNTRRWSLF